MSDHRITLTTRDGQDVVFACAEDSDVISAGEAASLILPSLCRDGGCGACLASCQTGDYQLGSYNAAMLPDEAKAQGDVLLCCTFPKSDLHISAPYLLNQIQHTRLKPRPACINALQHVAERTLFLQLDWLDDDSDKAVEFEPGQYMELEIPDKSIRRAYSLANTSNWQGEMGFFIRLQPDGQFSNYLLNQAEIGQVLNVYGPQGSFGLKSDSYNPALFIAGGTGIAPFLAILRRMADWGENRPVHLFFGVTNENELFGMDELERLQQQLPGLTVTTCVWKPTPDWQGFTGTPADALRQHLKDYPDNYDLYLCGPPMLVSMAEQTATAAGIAKEQIHAEKFA